VKEYADQSGTGASCEGGFTQCAAGHILQRTNKWGALKDTVNKPCVNQLENKDDTSAQDDGTKK
jgi:hypothetical protein